MHESGEDSGAAYDAGEMGLDVDDKDSDQQNGEVIH